MRARWDRFFDDIVASEEERLAAKYGVEEFDGRDPTELRRDARFVSIVWSLRTSMTAGAELFSEYSRVLENKRADLAPLQTLLQTSLGLNCQLIGREYKAAIADADIVFLDLYLGHKETESAINLAIERVRSVAEKRKDSPPVVVLMSASPTLHDLGPRVRDEGELLGCQFRMIRKTELGETPETLECLFDLLSTYPDSLKLNAFLQAWRTALGKAQSTFLQTIRTLDLADYANMQALILEAEDEPVGDYVVDLYDLYLHNVVEGDGDLIRSAKALNKIDWGSYPPAQFMPSSEAIEIMDGATFHNEVRTLVEAELQTDPKVVHLGDVFLAPPTLVSKAPKTPQPDGTPKIVPDGAEPKGDPETGESVQYVFVVLSQACDLQHGDADRVLLLRGTVRPYSWKGYEKAKPPRTPVMKVGNELFAIDWDPLAPETWTLDDLPTFLALKGLRRIRRFRAPFALQLQQSFIGRLGRVGTLAALPGRHPARVRVFIKDVLDQPRLIAETSAESGNAVCLVGRTEKNQLKEWLLLSETFRREIRQNLLVFPPEELDPRIKIARDNLSFYGLFKRGLVFARDKKTGSKPFVNTAFDLVQVFTKPFIEPGVNVERSVNPIIVEIDIS